MAMVKVKYLLRKSGLLYYQRAIPDDLKKHYSGKSLIRVNLGTQDAAKAARLIAEHASRDDVLWKHIRSGTNLTTAETRAAGKALLEARAGHIGIIDWKNPIEREALRLTQKPKERGVLLSEALDRYLAEHKRGQDIRFARDARRAIGFVESTVGDLPLQNYTREHARAVRDFLAPGHSTATVRRRLDSISAVFNLGRREFDLMSAANPFEKMQIQGEGLDAQKRLPFTHDELTTISSSCSKENDDIRWIVAMQLATGARLGEVCGLRIEDVVLGEIPYIWIRPHEKLGRTLKTPGSERQVPLVSIGLWAAKQAMNGEGTGCSRGTRRTMTFERHMPVIQLTNGLLRRLA